MRVEGPCKRGCNWITDCKLALNLYFKETVQGFSGLRFEPRRKSFQNFEVQFLEMETQRNFIFTTADFINLESSIVRVVKGWRLSTTWIQKLSCPYFLVRMLMTLHACLHQSVTLFWDVFKTFKHFVGYHKKCGLPNIFEKYRNCDKRNYLVIGLTATMINPTEKSLSISNFHSINFQSPFTS